ncbi:branched-chain amino acid aminotransferase II [Aulographum hederae CBS 113979]|uniref:Branched-chain-amino-acid aminotransferase n=1 Tax=Aulographum hederae CBS 113979 TaxID=1176131 RepID=A0A6G1H4E5_9PEZI|nr:branched-chain amino acid aminotransferase II [Aulographum hederae CBS 113979]
MSPSAIVGESTSELLRSGITHELEKTISNGHTGDDALAPLDASLLQTKLTTSPREVPGPNDPAIGEQKTCTDHMILVRWTVEHGWDTPQLQPYGPLTLMPTASCLHYATECFEGMKLYRGFDGKLRLFRPNLNAARMLKSANRIALPAFDSAELQKLVVALCARDGAKWLPKSRPGSFLYIRPTMIGSDAALGVQRPKEALLYIILACFPSFDEKPSAGPTSKPQGMKLLASKDDMVRAWPGGFGFAKVGANYGPSLVAQGEARQRGYDQILWLFGDDCTVTEAGASNFFVVWKTREGKVQLRTAPLEGKIILDGVTRRSILEMARQRLSNGWEEGGLEPLEVVEEKFTMGDVVAAHDEGRLLEAFAAGTAFFVSPVGEIHFRGTDLEIPLGEGSIGRYTGVIKAALKGIMYGKEKHEWGHVVAEVDA